LTLIWNPDATRFDGNPAATVALDRDAWQRLGATFTEIDDGDDETPGLAVGRVNELPFGVLDYGEGETFLLVPSDAPSAAASAPILLDALGLTDDVIHIAPGAERSRVRSS
jgi:hypothetical protein